MTDQEKKESSVAILFADIVGSSHLYDHYGDEFAKKSISETVKIMTDIVHQYSGTLIKTIGDEVMSHFPSADMGVQAAIFMQKVLQSEFMEDVPAGHLDIKAGLHYGPVIHDKNDIFGNAVNIAARLVAQAKARQILVSKAMIDNLSSHDLVQTRLIDRIPLKGIQEIFEIYEVICQEDATDSITANLNEDLMQHLMPTAATLHLRCQGKEITMDNNKRSVTMGRHAENDLIVHHDAISRLHAKIEYNRNKFILRDQSTNGTFVIDAEGQVFKVRRDEFILSGKGRICLGQEYAADAPEAIHFEKK